MIPNHYDKKKLHEAMDHEGMELFRLIKFNVIDKLSKRNSEDAFMVGHETARFILQTIMELE